MKSKPVHVFLPREHTFTYIIYVDDKKIGTLDFYTKDKTLKEFEIGYESDKEYRHKGYITTCIHLVCNRFKNSTIYAKCYTNNTYSIKALNRNGFIKVDTISNVITLKRIKQDQ